MAKNNRNLALFVALAGAAAWFFPTVSGGDLWWHLASGRVIWEAGAVLQRDPFSHTFAAAPWVNHEWLWQVVYWAAWRLHPDAVAGLNVGVLLTLFGLIHTLCRTTGTSGTAAVATTWAVAAALHWFLEIRPHLITLALTALLLLTRERRGMPWVWPLVIAAWVNVHGGGFVVGVGVITAIVLGRSLERSLGRRRLSLPPAEWTGLALCLAAVGLNPWGWKLLGYPLAYLDPTSLFRSLIEWTPPALTLDPRGYAGRFWGLVLFWLWGACRNARREPLLLATGLVTLVMAATARRFIPLFAVSGAPLVALAVQEIGAAIRRALPERARGSLRAGLALAAIALLALMWRDVRVFPHPLARWTQSYVYPKAGVEALRSLPRPPRRLLNFYLWGGHLLLHAPGIPVFIDGRANTVYDEALLRDYLAMAAAGDRLDELLTRYAVDAVFFPAGERLVEVLQSGPRPWVLVYRDAVAALLLPPGTARAHLSPPTGTGPEQLTERAGAARLRGELDQASAFLERALEEEPLFLLAYGELMLVHAQRTDPRGLGATLERGLRALPGESARLHAYAARAWEQLGSPEAARQAWRRARRRGPYDAPAS